MASPCSMLYILGFSLSFSYRVGLATLLTQQKKGVTQQLNYNGVCRGAPGFAQVCQHLTVSTISFCSPFFCEQCSNEGTYK